MNTDDQKIENSHGHIRSLDDKDVRSVESLRFASSRIYISIFYVFLNERAKAFDVALEENGQARSDLREK